MLQVLYKFVHLFTLTRSNELCNMRVILNNLSYFEVLKNFEKKTLKNWLPVFALFKKPVKTTYVQKKSFSA